VNLHCREEVIPDRQEEVGPAGDPLGAIGREAAAGDDAVQVGMKQQHLPPGMEHREETEFGAEMLGIGGDRGQGLCGGADRMS
jgi:hypothetical protein